VPAARAPEARCADRTGLALPGVLTQTEHGSQLCVAQSEDAGHRTQPRRGLSNLASFDSQPFGRFHTGPARCIFDRITLLFLASLDRLAKDPGPEAALCEAETGFVVNLFTHIHIPSNKHPCRVNSGRAEFNSRMIIGPRRSRTKGMTSLLRKGTGSRYRTLSLGNRILRLFRALPLLCSAGGHHSPGQ